MFRSLALFAFAYLAVVHAQQAGTNTAEKHPPLTVQQCSAGGSCTTQQRSIVLDSNWRWVHTTSGYTNCYTGNTWNTTICPDPATCAAVSPVTIIARCFTTNGITQNCALDGADYSGTYGITTSGNSLRLNFVTTGSNTNIGSRVYLLDDDSHYLMFNMKNQEFTFDVDMSNLPCGLNGAVYFVEMDADGGMAKYSTNKAGAKYGTGYCDTQCPHDIKFINGEVCDYRR